MSAAERAARVTDLFADLGPRSRAAVNTALRLQQESNVAATLVIQIPEDPSKPCEIFIMTGPVTMSVDAWKMGPQK